MKRVWIVPCFVFLVASPCLAGTPNAGPGNIAAALSLTADSRSCVLPQGQVLFAAGGGTGHLDNVCTANCSSGTVICTSTGTCTAVDRNCSAGQRGYVSCNGV